MAKENKYSIRDLKRDFPTDEAVLDFIFDSRHSRKCSCGGSYKRITRRKQYQCSKCRYQIAPTAGTVFHKSDTPLVLWFHAVFIFSNAKSGISAKELERQLGVTYKCAWRILSQIRKALGEQGDDKLRGDVETDAAYIGGVYKAGKNNELLSVAVSKKAPIIAAIERGGEARVKVLPNLTAKEQATFVEKTVNPIGTRLMTDKTTALDRVAWGYERHFVDHSRKEYVRGDIHVNNVETFWAHVKRSVRGTYKVVSKRHLQSYLDAFVFHYNNRHNDSARFAALLGMLLRGAR
ncbi:IS1595 family transposase [Candidatus Kaiserbacteria bacterium]|nr:IS1595 family transposase [Candidatus Kaiserbacteria bacterium]